MPGAIRRKRERAARPLRGGRARKKGALSHAFSRRTAASPCYRIALPLSVPTTTKISTVSPVLVSIYA